MTPRRRLLAVLAAGLLPLVAAGVLPTAASADAVLAARPAEPAADGRLSDEHTITRWARIPAPVRAVRRPGATGGILLRVWTEDGFPNGYLLLRRRTVDGVPWIKLRVPGRPNGRLGWVRRDALGAIHVVRVALVVNRRARTATYYRGGRALWRARVGVGKRSTPTPAGRFWIRERFRVGGHTLYGPYAFGTSAYSVLSDWARGGVVGLHGTDQPHLIPGAPSHGCIRMRNRDILWLARGDRLPVGAPLLIR